MGEIIGPALKQVGQFQSWRMRLKTTEHRHHIPRLDEDVSIFVTAKYVGSFTIPKLPGSRDEQYRSYDNNDLSQAQPTDLA